MSVKPTSDGGGVGHPPGFGATALSVDAGICQIMIRLRFYKRMRGYPNL